MERKKVLPSGDDVLGFDSSSGSEEDEEEEVNKDNISSGNGEVTPSSDSKPTEENSQDKENQSNSSEVKENLSGNSVSKEVPTEPCQKINSPKETKKVAPSFLNFLFFHMYCRIYRVYLTPPQEV